MVTISLRQDIHQAMGSKKLNKEIVLNLMYNGRYLKDDNNIGYEIINLYKSDSDENYIYLLPYGFYNKKHTDIETILLVRKLDNLPVLEILGKATGLEKVYIPGSKENIAKQKQLASTISYGGVSIKDIFRESNYQETFISFKARSVVRPAKKLYIGYSREIEEDKHQLPTDGDMVTIHTVGLPKQAQKQYFHISDDPLNYETLYKIIEEQNNWCDGDSVKKLHINKSLEDKLKQNFFDICGIADRELAFSNILGHFITKYPELMVEFGKGKGIDIDLYDGKSLEVIRESESNIDLLIKTQSHIIVVENKIRSGINGMDEREDIAFSQLDKYYNYIQEEYVEKGDSRKTLFVVLRPDYSNVDLLKYQATLPSQETYYDLKYSELYKFLQNKITLEPYKSDLYLNEYLLAIKKHSQEHYEDQFEIMTKKFQRVIMKRKQENSKQ